MNGGELLRECIHHAIRWSRALKPDARALAVVVVTHRRVLARVHVELGGAP